MERGYEFSISELIEAVADHVPQRAAIIHGDVQASFADLVDRSRRLARYLRDRGLGTVTWPDNPTADRVTDPGQDLLAQYLYNGREYLEGMLGGYRARLAPFNVNYRYVADELLYLLRDARPAVVQYHASLGPTLAEVLPELDTTPLLLHVQDGSATPPLDGAVDYEDALASAPPHIDDTHPSPDDLYLLYTGGTTGMPKGVLWRQADAAVALMAVVNKREGCEWQSLNERVSAVSRRGHRIMPLAPFIHGASQFAAIQALTEGNTVVIPDQVRRLDAADVWVCAERHHVTAIQIVGDAFARPLAEELERAPRALPELRALFSGGAALSATCKRRLASAIPHLTIVEAVGSSETGTQGQNTTDDAGPAVFELGPRSAVLSADMSSVLAAGHDGTGWLASRGRVPLGYLRDPDKSARTFPVVAGERFSVPGDRARLLPDGRALVLGRDSTTVNTGGEKVFVEEVEAALRAHSGVLDVVVCGRPSRRWGAEVTALIQTAADGRPDVADLVEFCATRIARYKLPKAVLFVDEVQRSPSGKPDYRWAMGLVEQATAVGQPASDTVG